MRSVPPFYEFVSITSENRVHFSAEGKKYIGIGDNVAERASKNSSFSFRYKISSERAF